MRAVFDHFAHGGGTTRATRRGIVRARILMYGWAGGLEVLKPEGAPDFNERVMS